MVYSRYLWREVKSLSLVENDLFEWFWELHPAITGLLIALLGPFAVWLIEAYRTSKHPDTKVPYGFNILRWTGVWIGDLVFITLAVAILTVWYDRVEVNSGFWTSWTFSLLCLLGGIALALLFIHLENQANVWRGDNVNLNRIWHTPYMAWVITLMLGA